MSYPSSEKNIPNDQSFICKRCGRAVAPPEQGTSQRNHCPHCLWSLHVDLRTGDRRSSCRGGMEPVSVWVRRDGEWAIIHRCATCGMLRSNRVAGDDDELVLFTLAARALTRLPFPLETLVPGELRS